MLSDEFWAMWSVLWQGLWIIPVGFVFYVVLSNLLVDFAYPIAENLQSALNIFLTYLLSGFILSLLSVLGDAGPWLSISLIVVSLTCAGLLRLYALRHSFLFPYVADSRLFDQFVVMGVSLALSVIFVVCQVSPLFPLLQGRTRLGQDLSTQLNSIFLVVSSFLTLICVELVWAVWSRLPLSRERARQTVARAITQILPYDPSSICLHLLAQITSRPGPWSMPELERVTGIEDKHAVQIGLQFLVEKGQILQSGEQAFRRHPHLFVHQAELVARYMSELQGEYKLVNAVEEALQNYRDSLLLAQSPLAKIEGVRSYSSMRHIPEGLALQDLMAETFEQLEKQAGRPGSITFTIHTYLDSRYRQGLSVTGIAETLGYSREHLYRRYHSQAISEFEQVLLKRIMELG